MTALTEFLFPAPARRSVTSIIGWWERRRLPYNLIVGAAGLVSTVTWTVFASLPPLGSPPEPAMILGIVFFGVMANVCYCLGPTVEILVEKLWGREVLPTGPALYRMGLTFSVGLALLPGLLIILIWIARIVSVVAF